MRDAWGRWRALLDRPGAVRPRGFPLFRTADLVGEVRDPRRWLEHQRRADRVVTLARGLHVVVPDGAAAGWRPDPVEAAWLLAAATHGRLVPYVSGLSAAAVHGICARPRGVVHVTVPVQTRARELTALGVTVRFHQRRERYRGSSLRGSWLPDRQATGPVLESFDGELCRPRVTSPLQTALDLEHSPLRSGWPPAAERAVRDIMRITDVRDVWIAATGQRRGAAAERALGFRWDR